ncbi:hypothetical protein Musp01_25070 [Muricauda sp. NBRC 101325]|nr:hypothetical protein Musp01_25070 [Muricauda sp. NBRC 101325]
MALSCKAQKDSQIETGHKFENLVLLAHDNYSNIGEYQTQIIRDQKTLQKFYSQVNKTRKPGLTVPIIDFSKEMLILVSLGEQRSQKNIVITKIKESDKEIEIGIEIFDKKKEGELSIQPMYYPFYLYKMPLVDKNLLFQKIE